jgi:hypothetical protein
VSWKVVSALHNNMQFAIVPIRDYQVSCAVCFDPFDPP